MANFFAWLFVNVAVPLLSPIALLLLLKVPGFERELSAGIVSRAIKDGQLFWTVIAMAASASYEAGLAVGNPAVPKWAAWTALVYHFVVLVLCAVLVMLGTVASARDGAGRPRNLIGDSLFTRASVFAATLTAATYSAVRAGFAG